MKRKKKIECIRSSTMEQTKNKLSIRSSAMEPTKKILSIRSSAMERTKKKLSILSLAMERTKKNECIRSSTIKQTKKNEGIHSSTIDVLPLLLMIECTPESSGCYSVYSVDWSGGGGEVGWGGAIREICGNRWGEGLGLTGRKCDTL
jgi:hypothetical protein